MEKLSLANLEDTTRLVKGLYPNVRKVSPLGEGAWSQAYSFESDNNKYVLRWSKNRQNFDRDKLAYQLFNNENLSLPKIFIVDETNDLAYAISEYKEGEFLESLPKSRLYKVLPSITSMLDGLRNADISNTTGYGFWDASGKGEYNSWREYLLSVNQDQPTRLTYRWQEKLKSHADLKQGFDELYGKLRAKVGICPEVLHPGCVSLVV